MIRNRTKCSDSAGTLARILALALDTSLGIRAVAVGQTLGIASMVGISSEIGQTLANGLVGALATEGVDATWRGFARSRTGHWDNWCCKKKRGI